MSFRPNSQDVVSATGDGAIYLARNAGAGNDYRQVYSLSGQSNPVAVAVSPDGAAAYVASSSGVVTLVNLTDATAIQVDCQCRPTTFLALSTASMFRISDISRTPIMLFDSSSAAPRTWFVPSPPDLAGRRHPVDGRGGQ
jgi:streptogramin lyase